jgi:hypothetical protein
MPITAHGNGYNRLLPAANGWEPYNPYHIKASPLQAEQGGGTHLNKLISKSNPPHRFHVALWDRTSSTTEPTRKGPERQAIPLGCFHFPDKHGQHHGPVLAVLKPNRIIRKRTDINCSSFNLRVFLGLSNPKDIGRVALYLYRMIALVKEKLRLT